MGKWHLILIINIFFLTCCSSKENAPSSKSNLKGEYIYRHQDEKLFDVEPPKLVSRAPYPWEEGKSTKFLKITKDFFRCHGSSLNPVRIVPNSKEVLRFYDCGGAQRHSLPLRDQKEFVYPILIDLLNHLQNKTGKKVVITCGHVCPDHNLYSDSSPSNQSTKHLIGAEVDFYIQGLETQPSKVVELITAYYQENEKYKNLKEYQEFQRYEKGDSKVQTLPWYNKEIFVKIYQKHEGRDFDNRHPYPYISIQVRHDWDLDEKVSYSWDKAFHNFHRF